MPHEPFEGIHAALLTPFRDDQTVNEEVLAQLVDDLIGNGVRGFVVNGSTGEGPLLSPQEWRRTIAIAQETAASRVPITVQVGALTTAQAVANAEHALEVGASVAMLLPPFYEPLEEIEVETYVRAVAAVGLPVMIYNNPGAVGWSMSTSLIARLAEIDGVAYLKDTTGDAARLFEIHRLVGDAIQILNGQDTLALLGFLAGTRASVWGAPNATPRACVRLWELAVDQVDLVGARALWDAFYPVNHFFETHGYVAAVKAATELRGIPVGVPRLPSLPLSDERRERLSGLLNALDTAMEGGRVPTT